MTDLRIGLALGGGGARGIAHIAILQAFDELGIKPYAITGTSIGAIMGAAFASGLTSEQIRQITLDTFANRNELLSRLWRSRPKPFAEIFNGNTVQFDPLQVLDVFVAEHLPQTFEQLEIPLCVLATDFYGCTETDICSGPLLPAIAASIAIPAVFRPVERQDLVLIDGGVVNPLPFDRLPPECDLIVAVDVVGNPVKHPKRRLPTPMDAIFGTSQILMRSITEEKVRRSPPDLLLRPDLNDVRMLDFLRTNEILERTERLQRDAKKQLQALITRNSDDKS